MTKTITRAKHNKKLRELNRKLQSLEKLLPLIKKERDSWKQTALFLLEQAEQSKQVLDQIQEEVLNENENLQQQNLPRDEPTTNN